MDKIGKFINVLQTINVTSIPFFYSKQNKNVGKEKVADNEKHLYDEEYICCITLKTESEVKALYNEIRISLTNLSQEQLRNRLILLQSYKYKELYEELTMFNTKYNNLSGIIWKEERNLKKVLRKHLIGNIPLLGRFTVKFLCNLTGELQRYYKYMEAIKNDIESLLGENTIKHISLADIYVPSLQYSISPYTGSSTMLNKHDCEINLYVILDYAFIYLDDPSDIKSYCIRQQKKSETGNCYEKEYFYKGLMKIITDINNLVKSKPSKIPTHIENFFMPGGHDRSYKYERVRMVEQVIIELFKETKALEAEQIAEKKTSTQPFSIRRFDLQSLNDALNPKSGGSYFNNIIFEDKFSSNNKESDTQKDSQLLSANLKDAKEEDLNKFKIEEEKSHSHVLKATGFSVFQWATIFYYADNCNLVPKKEYKKETRKAFIKLYHLDTTPAYFGKCYDKVNKRLNSTKDYPIEMLQAIIPFMKKNYKKTALIIKGNIEFLIEEKTAREKSDY